jgi:recombination associated protein RdgC
MFFRTLTLFRLSPLVAMEMDEDLGPALAQHRLRPVGPLEMSTRGFVSPLGRGEDGLTHTVRACTLFMAGGEDKLLPSSVVNDEMARRVQKIAEEEARPVHGRERRRIKDDVLNDLLPRAFVRSSRVAAYVDLANGWLVIDTSSHNSAESVVTQVREALGSFPARPLEPEVSPNLLLTDWLATGNLPSGFTLGDECELRDPATATGAVVRARRQDMEADEVREHLRNGKLVHSLGLVFDDRMSFVLDRDLTVTKLRFLDVVLDEMGDGQHDSAAAEMDARFALLTLEMDRLLTRFVGIFKIARPEG